MIICFVSTILYREFVLPPIQLLWINVIMDSLGSFALAFDSQSFATSHNESKDKLFSSDLVKYIVT